jgi:hypothetical protein
MDIFLKGIQNCVIVKWEWGSLARPKIETCQLAPDH